MRLRIAPHPRKRGEVRLKRRRFMQILNTWLTL